MDITFYEFSKRENSTALPTGSGTTYDCKLKDECSILSPSISLNVGEISAPTFNYAYIEEFERYYFINDWTYFQGIWSADLSVDTLATYKTDIGSSSLYVLRSASAYNGKIIDTTYPLIYKTTTAVSAAGNASVRAYNYTSGESSDTDTRTLFNRRLTQGYFIIGATADDKEGINYYMCDYDYFSGFFKYLIQSYPGGKFPDIIAGIAKAIYKPLSYLVSCYWIPAKIPFVSFNGNDLYIGETIYTPSTSTGNVSKEIDVIDKVCEYRFTIDIPDHPLTQTRGLWLNSAPYTELILSYMPFGTIPLPMNKLAGYTKIVCRVVLDITTGSADLFIHPGEGTLPSQYGSSIYHTSTMFGFKIPLTQSTTDILGAIGNLSQSVAGFSVANAELEASKLLGGKANIQKGRLSRRKSLALSHELRGTAEFTRAVADVPVAVGSIVDNLSPHPTTAGSPGSSSSFNGFNIPKLYAIYYYPTDEDNAHKGRPLCEVKTINTLSGFVKCATGGISANCTQTEKDIISSYLTGGFYYE